LEEYEFSRVFRPEDDNRRLFEGLQGLAIRDSVFAGVSETLFAYGQTGSGKTHTIFGTGNEPGLLQFFVQSVFERVEECDGSTVHICCYEVMGDSLTDLIKPEPLVQKGVLKKEDIVCDELFLKTKVCKYKIVQVGSKATCMNLLHEARLNRSSGVSSCNSSSSRSHAIVHIFVQNPALDTGEEGVSSSSIGALTLVDLAGAEKEHENPSEQGRKSARLLNNSLSSLNRLLRKLQTNSLDESERRQSVLNKCLWEYLRPGCGIALIFCVSPLFRHRTTSFSTLSMATASKLIHSRRKSQYIQVPAGALQYGDGTQPQGAITASPSAASSHGVSTPRNRGASMDAARRRARTPDATPRTSTPRKAATPRGQAPHISTPRRVSSTPAGARGSNSAVKGGNRASFDGSTPRGNAASSPICFHLDDQLAQEGVPRRRDQEHLHSASATSLQQLESQNAKLRRRLSKARDRSRDRLVSVEQERNHLNNENSVLRQECESLRSLFIRQQQQQIAFWAGPFMEMILPKGGAQAAPEDFAAAKAAVMAAASPAKAMAASLGEWSHGAAKPTPTEDALAKLRFDVPSTKAEPKVAPSAPGMLPNANLKGSSGKTEDRDYWQDVAGQLQKQMHGGVPIVQLSLEKRTIDTRSTSQQSSHGSASLHCSGESECGGNAEVSWSDSGTESTHG
jgi:hypothetical protein